MHFQLPQNLIAQVVAYDPVLKPLAKAEAANGAVKTPRMTLGLPTRLFPVEFLTEAEQLAYVTNFNEKEDRDRAIVISNDKGCGLLAYKSPIWMATWFFNKDHKKDYLYGVTYAYKATPATIKRVEEQGSGVNASLGWTGGDNNALITLFDRADAVEVKYGRIKMIERTLYVTEAMVKEGADRLPMESILGSYGRRDSYKRSRFSDWRLVFRKHLGAWADESNCFARIKEGNDVRRCVFPNYPFDDTISFVDLVIAKLTSRSNNLRPLMVTPFFKKEVNELFDKTLKLYMNQDVTSRRDVQMPWLAFEEQMKRVGNFLCLYPDATLDHCQQMYKLASSLYNLPMSTNPAVNQWLRNNMPIASYIGIIEKKVTAARQEWAVDPRAKERARDYRTGVPTISLTELNDTIQMLGQLYLAQNKGKDPEEQGSLTLAKPSRWRLTEFHDYLVGECFKLNTPNERLHQDLFRQPVKVEHSGQKWTFFQPQDIHQLASWGRAVRNCVGSADSYRNGIKKKTHFIVLAMLDNQPRFTIQLKVNNGVLNVEQIADTCNRNLSNEERENYQAAFGQALKILDQQITEAKQ